MSDPSSFDSSGASPLVEGATSPPRGFAATASRTNPLVTGELVQTLLANARAMRGGGEPTLADLMNASVAHTVTLAGLPPLPPARSAEANYPPRAAATVPAAAPAPVQPDPLARSGSRLPVEVAPWVGTNIPLPVDSLGAAFRALWNNKGGGLMINTPGARNMDDGAVD